MEDQARRSAAGMTHPATALEELEMTLCLEAIFRHYGYDFRDYAPASRARRIRDFLLAERLHTVSGLQEKVLHDRACFDRLRLALSVNTTAMFRDPHVFRVFRAQVVPLLQTYPFVRLWCAGCSSGEEPYALAILLQEEGLYARCRIYATDINEAVLQRAREGIFPLSVMQEYTYNYLHAGGTGVFSHYYTAGYDSARFRPELSQQLVFAQHNLVTDGVFNTFHVILCRNVMIYFNASLQTRVHHVLYDSLERFGMLCLGEKESLRFTPHEQDYQVLEDRAKIYQRRQ